MGFSVGAIPWTAIVEWCDFHGLDYEASKILIHVIRTLDVQRADAEAAKTAKETALGPGRARGRR